MNSFFLLGPSLLLFSILLLTYFQKQMSSQEKTQVESRVEKMMEFLFRGKRGIVYLWCLSLLFLILFLIFKIIYTLII